MYERFTDGKNSRETFKIEKDSACDHKIMRGTKASDGNADAEKEGCI